jgi:hypothetical protein
LIGIHNNTKKTTLISGLFFKKKKRKYLLFKAYSKVINVTVLIQINREDYDIIKVKLKYNKLIHWKARKKYSLRVIKRGLELQ